MSNLWIVVVILGGSDVAAVTGRARPALRRDVQALLRRVDGAAVGDDGVRVDRREALAEIDRQHRQQTEPGVHRGTLHVAALHERAP